jgi:hypothetical protein
MGDGQFGVHEGSRRAIIRLGHKQTRGSLRQRRSWPSSRVLLFRNSHYDSCAAGDGSSCDVGGGIGMIDSTSCAKTHRSVGYPRATSEGEGNIDEMPFRWYLRENRPAFRGCS